MCHAQVCKPGKVLDAAYFQLQISPPQCRQPIGLAAAWAIMFFDTLDPPCAQQPPQRSIQGACAQLDAPVADLLHIFEDGIAMPRLLGHAEQDQEYRLGKREFFHMTLYDMSYNAILKHKCDDGVKRDQ